MQTQTETKIATLQNLGLGIVEDGSAVIVIAGKGRTSRAIRYDSIEAAFAEIVEIPERNRVVTERRRVLAEDTFSRIEKSNAARDAFDRR